MDTSYRSDFNLYHDREAMEVEYKRLSRGSSINSPPATEFEYPNVQRATYDENHDNCDSLRQLQEEDSLFSEEHEHQEREMDGVRRMGRNDVIRRRDFDTLLSTLDQNLNVAEVTLSNVKTAKLMSERVQEATHLVSQSFLREGVGVW